MSDCSTGTTLRKGSAPSPYPCVFPFSLARRFHTNSSSLWERGTLLYRLSPKGVGISSPVESPLKQGEQVEAMSGRNDCPPRDRRSLARRRCRACSGGEQPFDSAAAAQWAQLLPQWRLSDQARRLEREWIAPNFAAAVAAIVAIALHAEQADHHPDIHLERYRCLRLELTTHAVGGLSENDFILAARIEELLVGNEHRRGTD